MDRKTLQTLEFPKILNLLAAYASFEASAELALSLKPSNQIQEVIHRQACTTEARILLSKDGDFSVRGARDIRSMVDLASRNGILEPVQFLDIKNTLVVARQLARILEKEEAQYPHLVSIGAGLEPPPGLVDAINRTISEHGDVLDSASPRLAGLRSELKISHNRLLSRLDRMISSPETVPMLQEPIITQRNGRYVIPLKAEFKGRIQSIIHDQSASGATLFIEPLSIVNLNNDFQEYKLAVRDEERRILAELSSIVGIEVDRLVILVRSLAAIDLALMCAKYAEDTRSSEPIFTVIEPDHDHHPGSVVRLYQARHPLLDEKDVVPIDFLLEQDAFMVVITGPNTGGKTVTLKTIGLLALMAQSGLHLPVQSGSSMSIFDNIYADIGDEQSIEQSLSTFSAHIKNIIHIIKHANHKSLVLLDELGAGTDPQEGAALASALLAYLAERKITSLVATHFPELKALAHSYKGMLNASMEFDVSTLKPTYHLVMGLPGRSNAFLIAKRLGLPESILNTAKSQISSTDLKTDDLLDEIHRQRGKAQEDRQVAADLREEAEWLQKELAGRLEKIEEERLDILERARLSAEKELDDVSQELDLLKKDMKRARLPLEELSSVQEKVENLLDEVSQPIKKIKKPGTRKGPMKVGEKVVLRKLGLAGRITAMEGEDIEVQAGILRIRVSPEDIQLSSEDRKERDEQKKPPPSHETKTTNRMVTLVSPGIELNLRGLIVEDAIQRLEDYLQDAYLMGVPLARIIHGKGTGRLREFVRQALTKSEYVRSWESGLDTEGGEGVTVVHFKAD